MAQFVRHFITFGCGNYFGEHEILKKKTLLLASSRSWAISEVPFRDRSPPKVEHPNYLIDKPTIGKKAPLTLGAT